MTVGIKFILLILAIIILIVVYDVINTRRLITLGVKQTEKTKAFERRLDNPEYKFLIVGDSSAVGVGALPAEGSIAGRLAADFPAADIQSLAVSGSKVADAIKQLESLPSQARYDLILIQIGGNDIVRRTPYSKLKEDFPRVLELAKQHSGNVVQLTSGNVGTSKLLPFGTRWYFTLRTKKVREIFMRINAEQGTHYIDLLRKRSDDPYAQDPQKYYSPDFFHPSAEGYGDWYAFVKPVVVQILQN
jgi:lysophospholipase L1-like esterase